MDRMNTMCRNCARLGIDCNGCFNSVYTGCVYKVYTSVEEVTPYIPILSAEDLREKGVSVEHF